MSSVDNTKEDILDPFVPVEKEKRFIAQPYNLLLLIALFMLLFPLFFLGQGLEVYIGSSIVFVSSDVFLYGLALLLLLYWMIYKFVRFPLSNELTWIHVAFTMFAIAYFFADGAWYFKLLESDKVRRIILRTILDQEGRPMKFNSFFELLFLGAQLVFVVNLVRGWLRRKP